MVAPFRYIVGGCFSSPHFETVVAQKRSKNMEKAFNDKTLNTVMELIQAVDKKEHVNDSKKIELMDLCSDLLREATEDVRITSVINAPFKSMGYISLTGEEITITSPKKYLVAASLASNIDIYPKTDGTVRMDLTFHGIARPAE